MSNALGGVRFKDGLIMFYEYNGTVDVCVSHLYNTIQEVPDNWRNHEWKTCECGDEEEVECYSSYGDGFYFKGKACRKCLSIRSTSLANDCYDEYSPFRKPKWEDLFFMEDKEDYEDDWWEEIKNHT